MPQHAIYIPQSRSARLVRASLQHDIHALYTDGFTSCNIIAIIADDKLALIHADIRTFPDHILEQITWAGEDAEIIWIARKDGIHVQSNLMAYLSDYIPRIQFKLMDDEHDGVYLSFDINENPEMHRSIRKFPLKERPPELLHHPDEQQFTAIVKCEQIIGLREWVQTSRVRYKHGCVFDGLTWEVFDESEMQLSGNEVTKEEIAFFQESDDYFLVVAKLGGIVQSSESLGISSVVTHEDLLFPIAMHLEGYLNDFDATKLFIRNLKILLTPGDTNNIYTIEQPSSSADHLIITQILKTLNDPSIENHFQAIQDLVAPYETNAPSTTFKKQLLVEISSFSRHYNQRNDYAVYNKNAIAKLQIAKRYSDEGITNYRAAQANSIAEEKAQLFTAARNLFLDAVKLTIQFSKINDPNLATSYFNLGRCCQLLGQHDDAIVYLAQALTLRKDHTDLTPIERKVLLEKTENAIAESESLIAQPSGSSRRNSL